MIFLETANCQATKNMNVNNSVPSYNMNSVSKILLTIDQRLTKSLIFNLLETTTSFFTNIRGSFCLWYCAEHILVQDAHSFLPFFS